MANFAEQKEYTISSSNIIDNRYLIFSVILMVLLTLLFIISRRLAPNRAVLAQFPCSKTWTASSRVCFLADSTALVNCSDIILFFQLFVNEHSIANFALLVLEPARSCERHMR